MAVSVYAPHQQTAKMVFTRPSINACFPAALYLILSVADLCCSQVAFRYGVAEGNPFMAWFVSHGCFVVGKILVSLLVASLMAVVYNTPGRYRRTVWAGVLIMMLVDTYHMWALPRLIGHMTLASIL